MSFTHSLVTVTELEGNVFNTQLLVSIKDLPNQFFKTQTEIEFR